MRRIFAILAILALLAGCNNDDNNGGSNNGGSNNGGSNNGSNNGGGSNNGSNNGSGSNNGGGSNNGSTTGSNNGSTGSNNGSNNGTTNQPPAPVVTMLDCGALPQALEGEDPLQQQFFVQFNIDLSCEIFTSDTVNNGVELTFEYYDEPENNFEGTNLRIDPAASDVLKVTGCSAGEANNAPQGLLGFTKLPRDEDITLTLTDTETEMRSFELVFEISPPYVALKSFTEN